MAMRRMHAPKGPKGKRNHSGRGSRGVAVHPENIAGKEPFQKHVKKLEPDDKPRPKVGAQHMPAQASKAKARRSLLKRLGHKAI